MFSTCRPQSSARGNHCLGGLEGTLTRSSSCLHGDKRSQCLERVCPIIISCFTSTIVFYLSSRVCLSQPLAYKGGIKVQVCALCVTDLGCTQDKSRTCNQMACFEWRRWRVRGTETQVWKMDVLTLLSWVSRAGLIIN